MANLTQEQQLALAVSQLEQQRAEAESREAQAEENGRARRNSHILATLSGVVGLGGGLGTQALAHYELEQPKPSYTVQMSEAQIMPNLANTILRINPQTGDTWIARKRTDDSLEWVQISNQAQTSMEPPSAPPPLSTSPSSTPKR
jgi:hypothetical protein